jgi:FG-GAP-like repeat/WD40-like Beta Propeller Repeat
MKTNIFCQILNCLFAILALMIFCALTVFTQTAITGVNGKIAFVSDREGNNEIYSINPDGTAIKRLTFNSGEDNYPAWSPEGSQIAYLSEIPSGGGQALMKIMNADGSGQRVVTPINFNLETPNFCRERFALDWSPDGSKVIFQEFGNIVTVNTDGTNRQNVTTSPLRESEPSWGLMNQITYASSRAINELPNSGLWIFLTSYPEVYFSDYGYYTCAVSPDLSADGAKLVYIGGHDLIPPGYIFIANPNPPFNERSLQFFDALTVRWSPDGNLLVFGSVTYTNPFYQHKIEIVDEFGLGRRVLTEGINPSWGAHAASPITPSDFDFDGDGRADISVFRPSDRVWYLNRSQAGFSAMQFGFSTDKITPADFDGDGRTDIAVFRDGIWYLLRSTAGFAAFQFGLADDVPQPADFSGDGRAELAVYRGGNWYTLDLQTNQFNAVQFGLSTDKPVAADYDGDGRSDYAVYRDGIWYLLQSTQGFRAIQFGLPTDKLVSADYDGDGKTDVAVYRDGVWYLLRSITGFAALQFGLASDIPAPADYDGDGQADVAVYRDGVWYLQQSTNGFSASRFGLTNDKPVPAAYLP